MRAIESNANSKLGLFAAKRKHQRRKRWLESRNQRLQSRNGFVYSLANLVNFHKILKIFFDEFFKNENHFLMKYYFFNEIQSLLN